MRAPFVERVAQREMNERSGCGPDKLCEDAVKLAELALRGRLLVMLAVLLQRLLVRVPACMRERRLLAEQQTQDAEKLENRALHLP
jgi:hypothetical protein